MILFIGIIFSIISVGLLIPLIVKGIRALLRKKVDVTSTIIISIVFAGFAVLTAFTLFFGTIIQVGENINEVTENGESVKEVVAIDEDTEKEKENNEDNDESNTDENNDNNNKEETEDLSDNEYLKEVIEGVVGKKTNNGHKRVQKASYVDNSNVDDDDVISLKIVGNDNLSDNLIRKGMWLDTADILTELHERGFDGDVIVMYMFPFEDKYGDSDLHKIMSFDFKADELLKINYDNLSRDNLPDIADDYFEHDSL